MCKKGVGGKGGSDDQAVDVGNTILEGGYDKGLFEGVPVTLAANRME